MIWLFNCIVMWWRPFSSPSQKPKLSPKLCCCSHPTLQSLSWQASCLLKHPHSVVDPYYRNNCVKRNPFFPQYVRSIYGRKVLLFWVLPYFFCITYEVRMPNSMQLNSIWNIVHSIKSFRSETLACVFGHIENKLFLVPM